MPVASPPLRYLLILNCGSATIKHKLYEVQGGTQLGPALQAGNTPVEGDYRGALRALFRQLPHRPDGVVHRIVHGGEQFRDSTWITPRVRDAIAELRQLAPLHNEPGSTGIEAASELEVPMVAVFDTSFHRTLPPEAYRYALPRDVAPHIRRFGFHGISHRYVTERYATLAHQPEPTLISLHLGGGCSATAVRGGQSVDTSMGFGPLEGLVMGSRAGDLDPTILLHLLRRGWSVNEVDELLNRGSGLVGLAGTKNMAEVVERRDEEALLTRQLFCYRIRKYVGSYLAVLEGQTQAVIFTGGIGENSPEIRAGALEGLAWAGIRIDAERNRVVGGEARISHDDAPVAVYVIPTDEELVMAREALKLWST